VKAETKEWLPKGRDAGKKQHAHDNPAQCLVPLPGGEGRDGRLRFAEQVRQYEKKEKGGEK